MNRIYVKTTTVLTLMSSYQQVTFTADELNSRLTFRLHGHTFYQYLVEGENRGEYLLQQPHGRGKLIVARDEKTDDGRIRKSFAIFNSTKDFFIWSERLKVHERVMYEVILDREQKPRFDVDINLECDTKRDTECGTECDTEYHPNVQSSVVSEMNEAVRDNLRDAITATIGMSVQYNPATDLMITSSHGSSKRSYHFVITTLYHNNSAEAKNFYDAVRERVKSEYRKYIDGAVYKKNQQFRLLGHSKYGADRVKILESYGGSLDMNKHDSDRLRDLLLLDKSLVSNTYECVHIPGHEAGPKSTPVKCIVNDLAYGRMIDLWMKDEMSRSFTIGERINGLVKLRRTEAGHCRLHNRSHDNENAYLFIRAGRLHYGCYRDGEANQTSIEIGLLNQMVSTWLYDPKEEYYISHYNRECNGRIFLGSDKEDATKKAYSFMKPRLLRMARFTATYSRTYITKSKKHPFGMSSVRPALTWGSHKVITKWPDGQGKINIYSLLDHDDDFSVDPIDMVPYVKVNPIDCRGLNLFVGYRATLLPSYDSTRIQHILYHIRDVLADGNQAIYRYLISWFAWLVQDHPVGSHRTETILVLYGASGLGKTIIADWFGEYVLGRGSAASVSGLSKITGRFNKLIAGKILCVINELESGEGHKDYNGTFETLKHIISDRFITVEPKGVDPYDLSNITNYICTTNHRVPMKMVEGTDRRVCMIECGSKHVGDIEYFQRLTSNPEETADHFMTYLHYLPESEKVPLSNIPNTTIKTDAIEVSLPFPLQFTLAVSRGDCVLPAQYLHIIGDEVMIKSSDLFELYVVYCKKQRIQNIGTASRFCVAIAPDKKFPLPPNNLRPKIGEGRSRVRVVKYDENFMVEHGNPCEPIISNMTDWVKLCPQ
jgi:hypothetical protein